MVEPIEPWFALSLAALLWLAYLLQTRHERIARRRARRLQKDN